jgi:hypothetical protein
VASGDSYKSTAYSYRMGDRTVSKIVDEVSTAIWDTMQPFYLPQHTTEMWETIARKFEDRWQFPHCTGALNVKHIMIKKSAKSGSSFFNYEQTFSPVLMVTVDAYYKFITIDVGSVGRFSDGNIFSSNVLEKKLNKRILPFPPPALLSNFEQPLPYFFVGDEALPLSYNLKRPYPKKVLQEIMKIKFLIIDIREHGKLSITLLVY